MRVGSSASLLSAPQSRLSGVTKQNTQQQFRGVYAIHPLEIPTGYCEQDFVDYVHGAFVQAEGNLSKMPAAVAELLDALSQFFLESVEGYTGNFLLGVSACHGQNKLTFFTDDAAEETVSMISRATENSSQNGAQQYAFNHQVTNVITMDIPADFFRQHIPLGWAPQ